MHFHFKCNAYKIYIYTLYMWIHPHTYIYNFEIGTIVTIYFTHQYTCKIITDDFFTQNNSMFLRKLKIYMYDEEHITSFPDLIDTYKT